MIFHLVLADFHLPPMLHLRHYGAAHETCVAYTLTFCLTYSTKENQSLPLQPLLVYLMVAICLANDLPTLFCQYQAAQPSTNDEHLLPQFLMLYAPGTALELLANQQKLYF